MGKKDRDSESGGPGCLMIGFLIGVALVALGGYLLGRWERLPGAAKASVVVMVVLGTLATLPMLVMWGIQLFFKFMFKRIAGELSKAGRAMIDETEQLYGKIHEFREADGDDFEGLDSSHYRETERRLAGMGYRKLGDVVDETIEEVKGTVTPIRVMASADGTTTAGFYHFVNEDADVDDDEEDGDEDPDEDGDGKEKQPRDFFVCDLGTEFTDGTFLLTSNTEGFDVMTSPPRIARRKLPLATPVAELLAHHEAEKQKLLAAKRAGGGVTCVVVSTLEEALAAEKRQQAAKNEFRKQIGFVDPEEVRRMGEKVDGGEGLGDMMARAVEEEKRKREG